NCRDVGMIQRCQHVRFALETLHPVRIGRELRWQELQRDNAIQLRIRRAIYLAHAALANEGKDFVMPDLDAAFQEHSADYTQSFFKEHAIGKSGLAQPPVDRMVVVGASRGTFVIPFIPLSGKTGQIAETPSSIYVCMNSINSEVLDKQTTDIFPSWT